MESIYQVKFSIICALDVLQVRELMFIEDILNVSMSLQEKEYNLTFMKGSGNRSSEQTCCKSWIIKNTSFSNNKSSKFTELSFVISSLVTWSRSSNFQLKNLSNLINLLQFMPPFHVNHFPFISHLSVTHLLTLRTSIKFFSKFTPIISFSFILLALCLTLSSVFVCCSKSF